MTQQLQDVGFETAGVLWALDPTRDTGYTYEPLSAVDFFYTLNAKDGTYVLRIKGDGATNLPAVYSRFIAVQPNDLVKLTGWVNRITGTDGKAEIRVLSYDALMAAETVRITDAQSGSDHTWLSGGEIKWVVPASGVSYVRVQWRINESPPAATSEYWFDATTIDVSQGGTLRIIASGELAWTQGASPANGGTNVTLTELGTGWVYTPVVFFFFTQGVINAQWQQGQYRQDLPGGTRSFVATTSAGSPTQEVVPTGVLAWGFVNTSGVNKEIVITSVSRNFGGSASSIALRMRYYVMVERVD